MLHTETWLWLCTVLFLLRVAGQLAVALGHRGPLPPMAHWMSGVMPYRYLLPSQLAILAIMTAIAAQVTIGNGPLAARSAPVGRVLLGLAFLYWGGMLLRLIVRLRKPADARPAAGPIPIAFHCVLAAFLFFYAQYHLGGRLSFVSVMIL